MRQVDDSHNHRLDFFATVPTFFLADYGMDLASTTLFFKGKLHTFYFFTMARVLASSTALLPSTAGYPIEPTFTSLEGGDGLLYFFAAECGLHSGLFFPPSLSLSSFSLSSSNSKLSSTEFPGAS